MDTTYMADPELGSLTPLGSDASGVGTRVVDAATPAQLFALCVLLLQNITKIRLFDGTDRVHVQFETGLPPSPESLAAPASAARTLLATLEQKFVEHLSTAPLAGAHWDPVAVALQTLLRPADPASAWTGQGRDPGVTDVNTPFMTYADPSRLDWVLGPAVTAPDSIQPRPTTLDLVLDSRSQTWRVELSVLAESRTHVPTRLPVEGVGKPPAEADAELRGETLDELRRKAPHGPGPGDTPMAHACFTAATAATYLGVDRSTITRRVGHNQLIGFTVFKRALRIPKEQFLESDVVPGIPDVLTLFPNPTATSRNSIDHRSAWAFLAGDLFHGDSDPRPIDRLRAAAATGTTELVLADLVRAKESLDRGDHL